MVLHTEERNLGGIFFCICFSLCFVVSENNLSSKTVISFVLHRSYTWQRKSESIIERKQTHFFGMLLRVWLVGERKRLTEDHTNPALLIEQCCHGF